MLDWAPDPTARLASFSTTFDYDPAVLTFNRDATTLLCDLRSPGVTPFCPSFPPGQGTTPLISWSGEYITDQTGLTITEDATGLPSVTVNYTAPTPLTLTGERNFLALAFDLLVPLESGATVTYSPTLLPDATVAMTNASCLDDAGVAMACDSNHPSLSFRIDPVPAPLAVGGLPVMVHASRRMRQRIRQVGR
jgi:hypothetical protein